MTMENQSLRTAAFVAISLATVAITTCLITFPLLFDYVQRVDASAQEEIDWCKTRSRDMWRDVTSMRDLPEAAGRAIAVHKEASSHLRQERAVLYQLPLSQGTCCTCQRGPPGPAGAPGPDGPHGGDGNPGQFGPPGDPVPMSMDYVRQPAPQCPCEERPGRDGERGPNGSQGPAGNPGSAGSRGERGPAGQPGNQGRPGSAGRPGNRGPPGPAGKVNPGQPGPVGTPGRAGNKGQPGQPGQPGLAGKDGDNGTPGARGNPGRPGNNGRPGGNGGQGGRGDPGARGGCTHCPPARLAPGY